METTTTCPEIVVEQARLLTPTMPTVTLTIIPPSRPSTPESRPTGNVTDLPLSPSSSNLSPLSPVFSSRPESVSGASDYGTLSCNTSLTNLSLTPSEAADYGARKTVYHIYHAGSRAANFTVHTVKDKKLVEDLKEEMGPVVLERGANCPTDYKFVRKLRARITNKPIVEKVTADDGKTDPRNATYYLHSPLIWFHDPPQTLRFGGDKTAPVVCLINGSFMWRTWRLDFVVPEDEDDKKKKKGSKKLEIPKRVDSGFADGEEEGQDRTNSEDGKKELERKWTGLNEPGVIDPRGVLTSKYPLESTYRLSGTGKKYVKEQTAKRRKSTPAPSTPGIPGTPELEEVNSRIKQRSNSISEKAFSLFRARSMPPSTTTSTPPPTPVPELVESMLPAEPDSADLPDHLKPDSLTGGSLLMKWSGWLTREYEFVYKGVELRWKGTSTVSDDRKYFGSWSRYNHLKLVAILPDEGGEVEREKNGLETVHQELKRRSSFASFTSLLSRRSTGMSVGPEVTEKSTARGREVVIAKYTCLAAVRKAGRLTIFEQGLEKTTRAYVPEGEVGVEVEGQFDTEKERLRHLVVATALCMVQGEKEKRETIIKTIELLLLASEAA